MSPVEAFLVWAHPDGGDGGWPKETRAPYATVDEAVAQAVHDLRAGRDVARIEDPDGKVLRALAQLRKEARGG